MIQNLLSQLLDLISLAKGHSSYSAAASGWAGWALAHPEFGSSVNPITTRGADYAHHITASPPGFEIPAASLLHKNIPINKPNIHLTTLTLKTAGF